MASDMLVFASEGHLFPYLARPPVAGSPGDGDRRVLCVPVLPRDGGFLLALPAGSIPPSWLSRHQGAGAEDMIGPSTELTVPAVEEEEDGSEVPVDSPLQVLVVDFATSAASYLEPYDPASLEEPVPVLVASPQVFPHGPQLVSLCKGWLRTKAADRLAFYTAPEEEEELLQDRPSKLLLQSLGRRGSLRPNWPTSGVDQPAPAFHYQPAEGDLGEAARFGGEGGKEVGRAGCGSSSQAFCVPHSKGRHRYVRRRGPGFPGRPASYDHASEGTRPRRRRASAGYAGTRGSSLRGARRWLSNLGLDSADPGPHPAGGAPDSEL